MNNIEVKNTTTGLLVLFLIYAHIPAVLELLGIPFYECSAKVLYYPRFYLFNSFYLTCFFLLEGMLGNFNPPLKEQVLGDVRKFLIPCFIFGIIAEFIKAGAIEMSTFNVYLKSYYLLGPGDYFVLYMLFFTRLAYRLSLYIKNNNHRLLLLLVLSFVGCLLNNKLQGQYRYWEQVLILLPFYEIGRITKSYVENKKILFSSAIVYCILCAAVILLIGNLPYIHDGGRLSIKYWLLYIVMGALGSLSLIGIMTHVKSSALSFVGRNLVPYILVHISILFVLIRLFYSTIQNTLDSLWSASLVIVLLFLVTVLLSTILAKLLNLFLLKPIVDENN